MQQKRVLAVSIALLVLLTGLVVGSALGAGKPSVTLFAAARKGDQIEVAMNASSFRMLPKQVGKKKNVPGAGHYHIFAKGPGTGGKFVYAGAGAAATGTTGGAAAPDFKTKPGSYQVRLELANNDHSPLKPPAPSNVVKLASISLASASVVEVKAKGKDVKQVQVTVSIQGLAMAPGKIGKAPSAGQGHFHILVDGQYAGAGAGKTATTGGNFAPDFSLSSGDHQVTVILALNNHAQIGDASNAISVSG